MVKKKSVRKSAPKAYPEKSSEKIFTKGNKYLFLSWQKILVIILAWFMSIVLHNVFYMVFGIEEAVFFIVAVIVIPIYFAVSFIYSFIKILRGKDKISMKLVASILIGLAGGFAVNYLGYFRGPWFFAFISLLIAFVVYRIIQFIFKKF
jgi:hypothetical protein